MGLDLYSRLEPLLGFDEAKGRLYEIFLDRLAELGARRVIDIGCGSGEFMALALERGFEIEGVDLSGEMVRRARARGLECRRADICELTGEYDAAVAVFDVLNYLAPDEVVGFLECAAKLVRPGGHFLADINTLAGFSEVAPGAFWVDADDSFGAIEAEFDGERLVTKMCLFEKKGGCYQKECGQIVQHYHHIDILKQARGLRLTDIHFITLFGEDPDKALLEFERV